MLNNLGKDTIGNKKNNNLKISLFDLVLIGILSGICIVLNFIDSFIPHIHPMHMMFLILIISVIGFYRGFILILTYVFLSFVIKGVNFILFWEQGLIMIIAEFSFLISAVINHLKKENKIITKE